MQVITSKTMTVAANGTISTALELEAYSWYGIAVPVIDSASLTIQGSVDGTNFYNIYDSTGTQQLTWTASTGSRCISSRDLEHCQGYAFIQIVLGASQTGGARTFKVCEKSIFPR